MSESPPMPLPPDIGKMIEPLLLGYLLQWALFGVLSVQVYFYYLAFSNHDPLQKKLLVYAVYAAEIVQAIILARVSYLQFGAGFGNFNALNAVPVIAWFGVPILSSIVVAVVQIFYAHRIKILGDTYLIPSVVVLLALLQLGGGITLGILSAKMPFFSRLLDKKIYIAAGILYGGSAVCDVLIAVYMTYLRKFDLKRTQQLIQKITHLIIGTGMLTAVLAITNLVLFLIPSTAAYYETVTAVLGKMHSNTMMVVLNSRIVYGVADDTESNELSSVLFRRSVFLTSQVGDPMTHEQLEWSDSKRDTTLNRLEESRESECVVTVAVPKKSTESQDSNERISA